MPTRRCARRKRTRIREAMPSSPACSQSIRPTVWEMERDLKKFSVPLLIIVGDEDEPCIDGSVYLKRTAPTAGLLMIPRTGHNVPTEEPAAFNAALADLFAAAEAGRWLAHKPSK